MDRRSRRRFRVGRESDTLANRRLPRPHEIVPRSVADLEDQRLDFVRSLDWPESRPAPGRDERRSRMVRQIQPRKAAFRPGYDVRALLFGRSFDVARHARPSVGRAFFCLRRKMRKEVLHAFGIAGRRGIGKRSRRTASSFYHCR